MSNPYPAIVAVVACICLAGCANLLKSSPSKAPVTQGFDRLEITSPSGITGEVAVSAFNHDGAALVCAAAGTPESFAANEAWLTAVLRASSVYINGEELIAGLPFATVLAGQTDMIGAEASCLLTKTPWKPDYDGSKARVAIGEVQL